MKNEDVKKEMGKKKYIARLIKGIIDKYSDNI